MLCDQMEDFFLNKYYKCEKLGKRLYFNEDKIQELKYYLKQEKKCKDMKEKGEDMVRTADSEIFSFAKEKLKFEVVLN